MEQQFDVLQTLGRGSFGVVRKVRRKADGKTLVVKEMDYGAADEKQKEQIVAEVSSSIEQERHSYKYVLVLQQSAFFNFKKKCRNSLWVFQQQEESQGRHRSPPCCVFCMICRSRHEVQGASPLSLSLSLSSSLSFAPFLFPPSRQHFSTGSVLYNQL